MRARLLIALLLLVPSGRGVAQSLSDPGFGVGAHLFAAVDAGSTSQRQLSGGVHSRYRLTGALGLEVSLDVRLTDYELQGEKAFRLLVVPLTGTFQLFLLPRSRVQPYLAAGAGYYFIQGRGHGALEQLGTQTENRFGFHGGIGLDVRPSRRSSVHVDVRYVLLESNVVPDGETLDGLTEATPSADYWSGTVGITFYF